MHTGIRPHDNARRRDRSLFAQDLLESVLTFKAAKETFYRAGPALVRVHRILPAISDDSRVTPLIEQDASSIP